MTAVLISLMMLASPGLYEPAMNPAYAVESKALTLHDSARKKDLPVRVTYPKGAKASLPVIVFSHGMFGSGNHYEPLAECWAGAGYVVLQPTHEDSLEFKTPQEKLALARDIKMDTSAWRTRPGDISFCIDQFATIEKAIPALKGKLDSAHIGIGGHSFGGWTTQVCAGMTMPGGVVKEEPRATAFVSIAGTGTSPGVGPAAMAHMRGPILFITGDNDTSIDKHPPTWRKEAFDYAKAEPRYLAWITDATHAFGGISRQAGSAIGADNKFMQRFGLATDRKPEHVHYVQSLSLALFDSALRNKPEAKRYLAEKFIEKSGQVKFTVK